MADTSVETRISLKIFVDREKNSVVFAEADYSFVDHLFSFMTLPMATIIGLLREQSDEKLDTLVSLSNLYESVANLPATEFRNKEVKSMLLHPGKPSHGLCRRLKLKIDNEWTVKYFRCVMCEQRFVSAYSDTTCCYCGRSYMWSEIRLSSTFSSNNYNFKSGVFVKDTTTFIITDNLHVIPNTPVSMVRLLKDLGDIDMSHLEERTVEIGLEEILNLLKRVLSCKSPLTHLFFPKTNANQNMVYPYQGKSDQLSTGKERASNSKNITFRVTWQKSIDKVLFAEVGEDFIDLLISFLIMPLGTLVGKLNGATSVGSIDNLYSSILNMNVELYMQSQDCKDMLLHPHTVPHLIDLGNTHYASQDPIVQRGFFKGKALFIVTDDLVVTPLPSISVLDFLKKLNVPISDIEEHEMMIGIEEGLRILKASLKSSSALTDVLNLPLKKPKRES